MNSSYQAVLKEREKRRKEFLAKAAIPGTVEYFQMLSGGFVTEEESWLMMATEAERMALKKMNALEMRAETLCESYVEGIKVGEEERALFQERVEYDASEIGKFIAEQLVARNFRAVRMIVDGLQNVRDGKPFIAKAGKSLSPLRAEVLAALLVLTRSRKTAKPSISEICAQLKSGNGITVSKDRVSKIITDLKQNHRIGDAREADSDAGKRRRRKP